MAHVKPFKTIKSKNPCGYLCCQNMELFIEALTYFHLREPPNKEANLLFGPRFLIPIDPVKQRRNAVKRK
jgi:hypothetical protein